MESLYFEDLVEGQTFVSRARTVTETDVVGFAGLSGDFNPIHLDRVSSERGLFGQRVAHGVLGIAMATGFLDSLGLFKTSMGAMLSIDHWNFIAPIFINDSIHLELSIQSKRLASDGTRGIVARKENCGRYFQLTASCQRIWRCAVLRSTRSNSSISRSTAGVSVPRAVGDAFR